MIEKVRLTAIKEEFDYLTPEQRSVIGAESREFFSNRPDANRASQYVYFESRVKHHGWWREPLDKQVIELEVRRKEQSNGTT